MEIVIGRSRRVISAVGIDVKGIGRDVVGAGARVATVVRDLVAPYIVIVVVGRHAAADVPQTAPADAEVVRDAVVVDLVQTRPVVGTDASHSLRIIVCDCVVVDPVLAPEYEHSTPERPGNTEGRGRVAVHDVVENIAVRDTQVNTRTVDCAVVQDLVVLEQPKGVFKVDSASLSVWAAEIFCDIVDHDIADDRGGAVQCIDATTLRDRRPGSAPVRYRESIEDGVAGFSAIKGHDRAVSVSVDDRCVGAVSAHQRNQLGVEVDVLHVGARENHHAIAVRDIVDGGLDGLEIPCLVAVHVEDSIILASITDTIAIGVDLARVVDEFAVVLIVAETVLVDVEALVNLAVTVVVDPVAELGPCRIDAGGTGSALFISAKTSVTDRRVAGGIIDTVRTALEGCLVSVAIEVGGGYAVPVIIIDIPVAIVVRQIVADFDRRWVDGTVRVIAIVLAEHPPVQIGIIFVGWEGLVAIVVEAVADLCGPGIGKRISVVTVNGPATPPLDFVPVSVPVGAEGYARGVLEIDKRITVIVDAVEAVFVLAGVDARIAVIAVVLADPIAVSVEVVLGCGDAAGAVVVLAVADLRSPGIGFVVRVVAVPLADHEAVIVCVGFVRRQLAVAVIVLAVAELRGAGIAVRIAVVAVGAVVHIPPGDAAIGDGRCRVSVFISVAVLVNGDADAFIDLAVAVVVGIITDLDRARVTGIVVVVAVVAVLVGVGVVVHAGAILVGAHVDDDGRVEITVHLSKIVFEVVKRRESRIVTCIDAWGTHREVVAGREDRIRGDVSVQAGLVRAVAAISRVGIGGVLVDIVIGD